MVLTNSYPCINSLLDPISEAHDQLIELGSLSPAVLPARGPTTVANLFYLNIGLNAVNNVKTNREVGKG